MHEHIRWDYVTRSKEICTRKKLWSNSFSIKYHIWFTSFVISDNIFFVWSESILHLLNHRWKCCWINVKKKIKGNGLHSPWHTDDLVVVEFRRQLNGRHVCFSFRRSIIYTIRNVTMYGASARQSAILLKLKHCSGLNLSSFFFIRLNHLSISTD